MDKAILVEQDLEDGRKLLQALDHAGFPVVAALWNYSNLSDSDSQDGDWRLLIASPKVSELGPRAAYKAIQDVLLESGVPIRLDTISVMAADDPAVTQLRVHAGTDPAPFIGGEQMRSTSMGSWYVDKAYVYRAARFVDRTGGFELWFLSRADSGKLWIARRTKVTVEEGFFRKIEVQGYDLRQSHSKNGVNARLRVLANPDVRRGKVFGDVTRWVILDGRLREVAMVARDARIKGYDATPLAANTAP